MGTYFFEGEKIQFNDLSEEMQRKLYLKDKEKFKGDIVKSRYPCIRKLIIKEEECDTETLNELFELEVLLYGHIHNLKMIMEHQSFQMNDEKCKMLAESDSVQMNLIAAEYEKTSSEMLNHMLRTKVVETNAEEVVEAILSNPNFKMEEETRKILAKSEFSIYRCMAAESEEASSEFLNEMLRNEVQGDEECDVIELILNNPNFKMDDETRAILARSNDSDFRQLAAEDQGSFSKFLNYMLRNEVQGPNDSDVIDAILKNPNFEMDELTRIILSKSCYEHYREMIANSSETSEELLEDMYLNETNTHVLEVIELNLFKKISKSSVELNAIQKRQIFEVLKEVRISKFVPLSKYLKKILKIIS